MDEQGTDLRHVVGLLRRQLWVIAIALATALTIAVIALMLMPTVFTGTTLIMVDPARRALIEPEAQSTSAMSESWRVDSELEILQSDAVLLAVVQDESLDDNREFSGAENAPQIAVAALREALDARREGMTSVISVSVTTRDPELSAQLANGIAEAFIGMQSQEKAQSASAAAEVIEVRLASARDAVTEARTALDAAIASQRLAARPRLDLANLLAAERLGSIDPQAELAQEPDVLETARAPIPALDGLETALIAAELHYRTLIERQTALDLQSEFQLADSRIVSPALVPVTPSAPNRSVTLLVALLGGLGVGVGLAFGREAYVGGITGPGQLAAATRRPLLAVIPDHRSRADHLVRLVVDHPLSRYGEAIRRTRLGLDRAFALRTDADGEGQVVLVSSARHGEGKSVTALALGRSYALAGRKTLLIDCDLRRPAIQSLLDGAGGHDMPDALDNAAVPTALGAMLLSDTETGMSVVVGTHPADMTTEDVLASSDFARMMAAAVTNFDIVILDGPAIGESTDALHLARFATTVLLVVRWAHTPQSQVRQALAQLGDAAGPHAALVTVLNRARDQGAGSNQKHRLTRNGLRPVRRWGREERSRQ